MDFLVFVYAYLCVTAFLIFVLLFGDAPWASGTPLSFSRWLITEAWVDGLEWTVTNTCGLAGIQALDNITECCCQRSNPTLQIAYLIIWSVGYALYWEHVFKLLPNLYAAEFHLYTGTAAVCITLSTFLLASASSPGHITPENAAVYLAAYPPDGLLFPPKACFSCQLPRPGRSKHCGACGGCVPRFDHHCGWVNSCVGLHNTRTFLLFLAANLATCCYALWLLVTTMRGELHKRGLFDVYVYDPMTRERAPLHKKPAKFVEFMVVRYSVQVALGLFITVGGLLMAAFLAYQAYLISVGCTTYEQFKRNAVHKEMKAFAAAQAAVAAAEWQHEGDQQLSQVQERQQQQSSRRSWAAPPAVAKPPATYNRGFRHNWLEVLAPEHFLRQQQQQRSVDAGVQQSNLSVHDQHISRGQTQQQDAAAAASASSSFERKQQ